MKLKLKNFRCHLDKEIDIEERGLLLINGESGSGKTTIVQGILYALYGEIKKPCTFGLKKCSVSLTIDDMNITRINKPKRLTLNYRDKNYEDEEAQQIIIKNLGMNYHEFMASSYIKQKMNNSILSLTPAEQLKFIEKIALDDDHHIVIKNKLKELIKKYDRDMAIFEAEKNMAKGQFDEEKKKVFDVKKISFDQTDEEIKEDVKKFQKQIEGLIKEKDELKKQIKKNEDDREQYQLKNMRLSELRKKLAGYKDINQLSLTDLSVKTDDLNIQIDMTRKYRKYQSVLNELNMAEAEIKKHEENILPDDELKELEKKMRDLQLKKSILEKVKKGVGIDLNDLDSIDEYLVNAINERGGEIDELEAELDGISLEQGEVHQCPNCKTHLILDKGELIETAEPLSQEAIEESEKKRKRLEILSKEYEKYEKYYDMIDGLNGEEVGEDFQEIISAHKFSKRLISEKRIDMLRKKVESMKCEKSDIDIEKAVREVAKNEAYIEQQWGVIGEKTAIELDIKKLMDWIGDHPISYENNSERLTSIDLEINYLYEQVKEGDSRLMLLLKYNQYKEHLKKLKEWKGRYSKAKKELTDSSEKYKSAMIIKEKCKLAEIMALDETINSINEHARHYLNMMFVDERITVRLENFKKVKKNIRCKMNIFVQYKGAVYDDVDQLSGGEKERVSLAFILAVNSMMNSSFLFLDESLASLDTKTNSEIFTLLRDEIAKTKAVVVVSHEANRGIFDKVYDIEE